MDINQQLNYIRSLVDAYNVGLIEPRIKALEKKLADKRLYIAVVGEFSSGKSTFINALLGRRILKEAVMPTTACATYISKSRHEFKIDVTINRQTFKIKAQNIATINKYLKEHYGRNPSGIQDLIDTLTSDQEVAIDVKKMTMQIPDIKLPDDVVVIDTPGFNPGGVSVESHFEITKEVVTQHADVALILMPSDQAFSNSISEFLSYYVRKYLHRCVFVATKGDQHSRHEAQVIECYVRDMLKGKFNLDDTEQKVFCESAITMLPVVKVPESMKADWQYWQEAFKSFEQNTWALLLRQKDLILSEHIQQLTLSLIKQLQDSLTKKQQDMKEQKALLEKGKVDHIREVTNKMMLSAKAKVSKAFAEVNEKLSYETFTAKDLCIKRARENLNIGNSYAFNTKVEPIIRQDASDRLKKVLVTVNNLMSTNVKKTVNESVAGMQEVFRSHYALFPSLSYEKKELKLNIRQTEYPNIAFGNTNAIVDKNNDRGGTRLIGGAAAGAAAGALAGSLIPVVGTFFGALGGAIYGLYRGGKSSEDLEREEFPKVKAAMENEINAYFISFHDKVAAEILSKKKEIDGSIEKYANNHTNEYGVAVEGLIKQQEDKIQTTECDIKGLTDQVRNLEDIENEIQMKLLLLNNQK